MKRWLFLLLFFPVVTFGQFRMVSSTVTLDSTVNDSTYIIDVDFFSDQTAKGYFASGITADYRVFSQTGQLYDITAANNLTLSSGELTIVEIDNNYVNTESAPVGQILVFDPQGDYITFTPFGNSNMGQVLQQAIGTYNAVVSAEGGSVPEWSGTANYEQFKQVSQGGKIYTNRTGTNTTTPPSSDLVNWELTNKSAILEEIEGRDTISQLSHPFEVGDPLWYSGDYLLSRDTGSSVRVDGVVVEVIDANTFIRQRTGKFVLTSHGFAENIQLYVQSDGTYGPTAGDNALAYGYAISANEIEIGVKSDQIASISERFNDNLAGRGTTTKQAFLDSLAGFQSFADIASIQAASPRVGYRLEDRRTGVRYRVQSDSVMYHAIDDSLVIDLSGKYAVADLSGKRIFLSKDQLRNEIHFLDIEDGELIEINGKDFEVRYSPKLYSYTTVGIEDEFALDSIPDGFFVDTVRLSTRKNAVLFSDDFVTNALSYGSGTEYAYRLNNAATPLRNIAKGPDGDWTADAITFTTDPSYDYLRVHTNRASFSAGDTVTFSFWYKGKDGPNASERLDFINFPGTGATSPDGLLNFTLDDEWHQWSYTLTYGDDGSTFPYLFSVFRGFSDTDTLYIDKFKIEHGSEVTSHIRTNFDVRGDKDMIYLYRRNVVRDNKIYLEDLLPEGKTGSVKNAEIIVQAAIDHCQKGKVANTIVVPKRTFLFNDSITAYRGINIVGENAGFREYNSYSPPENVSPIWIFDFQDTTKYCINFNRDAGMSALDNIGLSNLHIELQDSARVAGFLRTDEAATSTFENLTFKIGSGTHIDVAGWNFATAIASNDSHYNTIRDIAMGDASDNRFVGILYGGGVSNFFDIINVACDTGVLVRSGYFQANRLHVEGCQVGLHVEGDRTMVDVNNMYTEASAYDGGPTINQESGFLRITNLRMQTHSATDTIFAIRGGNGFEVDGGMEFLHTKKYIAEGIPVTLHNLHTLSPLYNQLITPNPELKNYVDILNNRSSSSPTTEYRDNRIRGRMDGFSIDSSYLKTPVLADTVYLSNVIWKTLNENLVKNSQKIIESDTVEATWKGVVDALYSPVDGSQTADVLIGLGVNSFTTISENNHTTFENFEPGWYTASIWAKTINVASTPSLVVQAPVSSTTTYINLNPIDTAWNRYSSTYYVDDPSLLNYVRLRIANLQNGDTLGLSDLQINKGKFVLPNVVTTTTGLRESKELIVSDQYRTFTPIVYDNSDTLLVDRLELGFDNLKITDELDGLEVKQVTFTTDRNVTDDTGVRLEYFDISGSSYTSFGSGTILNGTNQITVTGLSQAVEAGDIIYMEITSTGGEANGISANIKFQ